MEKTALVLSGGGSRGAYEIGVWQALWELDEQYSIVTGSSVGALNGAMVAQGSFELAQRLWRELETSRVFDVDLDESLPKEKKWLAAVKLFGMAAIRQGGAGAQALRRLMETYLDEDAVRRAPVEFGVVTVRFAAPLKPCYVWIDEMPPGRLVDYLLASSALFPAVQPHRIDGQRYIDGGFADAMPVRMAIAHGATRIIAVNIESLGIIRRDKEFHNYEIREIKSYWNLGSVLLFDPMSARQNMRLGYLDAMRSYGVYDGFAYAFIKGAVSTVARKQYAGIYERLAPFGLSAVKPLKALEKRAARRMAKAAPARALVLDGMESAGELFGLDAAVLYTPARFIERLKQAVEAFSPEQPDEEEALVHTGGIPEMIAQLTDRRARALAIARIISGCLCGDRKANLAPLCSLLTEEFSAALFLALACPRRMD